MSSVCDCIFIMLVSFSCSHFYRYICIFAVGNFELIVDEIDRNINGNRYEGKVGVCYISHCLSMIHDNVQSCLCLLS